MTSPNPVAAVARNLREFSIRPYSLEQGRCVVAVAGELDLASAPALKSALTELSELGYTHFVLELSGVTHMDSTGLGVLVGFRNRLEQPGRLRLAAVPPNVGTLLSLVGLDTRIESHPTLEAALAELDAGRPQSAVPIELPHGAPHPVGAEAHPAAAAAPRRAVRISTDARLVLGLASTALPFAESELAEAERWLRILRRYGDAGRILRESGVREAPFADLAANHARSREGFATGLGEDPLAAVSRQAERLAAAHGVETVGTAELLKAVMATYGSAFERALRAYGGDRQALELALTS